MKRNGSKLHLCGLIGDGGVHAHQSHLYACLRLAAKSGLERVYIHAFTDGRDTSPFGAREYMTELLAQAREIDGGIRRASPPSPGVTTRWTATIAGSASRVSIGR